MNKLTRISLGLFAAALLLVPSVSVFAQTPPVTPPTTPPATTGPTITWQELEHISRLEALIPTINKSTNRAQFDAAVNEASAACANLNAKMQLLSPGWGAKWVGPGTSLAIVDYFLGSVAACQVGEMRNFSVTGAANPQVVPSAEVQTYLNGFKNSKNDLTPEKYAQREAQLRENSDQTSAWWKTTINVIVTTLSNVVASVLAGIAVAALSLLSLVVDYAIGNNVNFQPDIINKTWYIVRDYMNLVFILALIVMAIGTILQREQYNRRLLGQLILMALLINFSQVIANTLISFSDMLIALFKPEGTFKSYTVQIYSAFVTGGDGLSGVFGLTPTNVSTALMESVTRLIGLFILTISVCAFAGLMLVRMIALWFLVMISPAAYALNILPQTAPQAKKWWDFFIKCLIWGPVGMFFFRVGFILINNVGNNLVKDSALNPIIMGGFFYAGYYVAKTSGMVGASIITSTADKMFGKGKKWLGAGAKATGNYAWRGTGVRHAARLVMDKDRAAKWGENVGQGTAWLSNRPKALKEKFVDKGNTERKKLVEKQYRRMQIDKIYTKDFSKEIAGSLNPADIYHLAETERLNEDKVKAIIEHGGRDAVDTLMLAVHDGRIDAHTGLKDNQKTAIKNMVATAKWKAAGGKEYEITEDFLEKFEKQIKVKATRPFNDKELELIEEHGGEEGKEMAEKERADWAKTTLELKDRKAVLDNKYVRGQIKQARKDTGDDETEGNPRVRASSRKATQDDVNAINNPPTPPPAAT